MHFFIKYIDLFSSYLCAYKNFKVSTHTRRLMDRTRIHTVLIVFMIVLLIVILGVTAGILALVRSRENSIEVRTNWTETKDLLDTINSTQLMYHLTQLQAIADHNNGTRSLGTSGFKDTFDYIENQLKTKTNFEIFKEEFYVMKQEVRKPILASTQNGIEKDYVYERDFSKVIFSTAANLSTSVRLTIIPNSGCNENDWQHATPHSPANSVVLVINDRNCTASQRSIFAQKFNTTGLLFYDWNINSTSLPTVFIAQNTTAAMIISYELGRELIEGIQNTPSSNVSIRMFIAIGDIVHIPTWTANLCADTQMGSKTQVILIGSHSDSVDVGPGINDNGSGAMASLVLALNLAQLFKISSYEKYLHTVRFCWFAAEENNLLGSRHHVEQAYITESVGRRLKDYAMMLNLDMLASVNYIFGVYESLSISNVITATVQNGSMKISRVFQEWFEKENLPWDNSSLGISSDHVPFLLSGIASGGLFSGADSKKTVEQRNRYRKMLGYGHGGMALTAYDICYHQECDTIENISPFAYEKLVKAVAYALQKFARMPHLYNWLYENH